jgi:hypothetical protein
MEETLLKIKTLAGKYHPLFNLTDLMRCRQQTIG